MSKVKVKYGVQKLINLGDFENVRIESGVEMECESEEVVETHKRICKFVNKVIEKESEQWEN